MRFSGANLRRRRETQGMRRTQLAALTGVSEQSITAYELGNQVPTVPRLAQLATILDCTTDDLFDHELVS